MEHMFMATEITEKGLAMMADYVAAVREVVGMEIPLSADHFGPLSVNSCIRLGKALTKYNLSWLEDMIPWQETELLKKIADAVDIPVLTGEDIFLKEPFEVLCRNHAVDIIHPDLLTYRRHSRNQEDRRHGAGVRRSHGAALRAYPDRRPRQRRTLPPPRRTSWSWRITQWMCPYWSDLVDGIDKPIVNKGYITVPEKPGLGITLNEAACKQHLAEPGWFEPTDQWNNIGRPNDRLWS